MVTNGSVNAWMSKWEVRDHSREEVRKKLAGGQ